MVCCALIVTTLFVRREFFLPAPTGPVRMAPSVQADWQIYASSGHVLGSPDAEVTIVEFADFECPYCRKFSGYVDSLRLLGKRLRVVYRHFPLPSHRFAIPAARASECASEQGRFDAMHSVLYSRADSLGVASWWWFARLAGVSDSARFASCIRAPTPVQAIDRDSLDGKRLKVTGTPTLLIERLRVDGLPPFDSLRVYVDRVIGSHLGAGRQRKS
jgi:protein-disulfide isomerase